MLREQGMVQLGADEIGEWVLQHLSKGRIVEFALTKESENEYTDWWFMTWVDFPGYDSRALYIDYCGGGFAKAIPYDGDEEIFCDMMQLYFAMGNDSYDIMDKINIEIKED